METGTALSTEIIEPVERLVDTDDKVELNALAVLDRQYSAPSTNLTNNTRETMYAVGQPIQYTSAYGYRKRRIAIIEVPPGKSVSEGHRVDELKEELVPDESGRIALVVYYAGGGISRHKWRKHGKPRFYTSPEAFLLGCGLPVLGQVYKTHQEQPRTAKQASPWANTEENKPAKATTPRRKKVKAKKSVAKKVKKKAKPVKRSPRIKTKKRRRS